MITFANEEHKDKIIALWHTAFGDEAEFIRSFLSAFDYKKTCLVCTEQEKLISMLFMLPVCTNAGGRNFCGKYIYAVATDPTFRSKGYAASLMGAAEDFAKKDGCAFTVLVPASERLFIFYSRLGYSIKTYVKKAVFTRIGKNDCEGIEKCSADELFRALSRSFSGTDYIYHPAAQLEKIVSVMPQGGAYKISCGKNVFYALCDFHSSCVLVKETTAVQKDELLCCANALLRHFKAKKVTFAASGGKCVFSLIKPLSDEVLFNNPYFNIAID